MHQVGADEIPALRAIMVARAVIDSKAALRIFDSGMLRVEEQRTVSPVGGEDTVRIQPRAIKCRKIILGENLLAVRTSDFPRAVQRIDLP